MVGRRSYRLGPFRLDPESRVLFRADELVSLPPKAVDTLILLVERRGSVVDKDTLMKEVWPDSFVEEGSLTRNISLLRKVLPGEEGEAEWIETIPKRGYRFVGLVEEVGGESAADEATTVVAPVGAGADAMSPPQAAVGERGRDEVGRGGAFAHPALVALVVAVLAAGVYFAFLRRGISNTTAGPRAMLVVLPVQNLTGDANRDYLADGLTEELISQFGSLNPAQLGVIARTSSMAYRSSNKTIAEIAHDLDVDYVVETSVRGTPERLRFTAQLIRAKDQTHLWAQDFDRDPQDLVALEDDLSRRIAAEVSVKLTPTAAARAAREMAIAPASYQSFLRGRYYWNERTREGMEKGLDYFQEAVKEDPKNARALAGIADSYNTLLFYGYSTDIADKMKAQQAAARALQIDDSLADAHASLGYVYFMWTWQWAEAEAEFRRAIELDRNYAPAHHWYALYLAAMGRAREADAEIRFAETLDPVSPIVGTAAAYIHYFGRDFDKAIAECQGVLAASPNFVVAHAVLGMAYEAKGMLAPAAAELEKAVELSNQSVSYRVNLARVNALAGNRAKAQEALADLENSAKRGAFVGQYNNALVYAALGDTEHAVEALSRAQQQNDAGMIWLGVDPRLDGLRGDAKFQQVLRRMKEPKSASAAS